ncbi:MAG: glycosyltransferase family 4 protein, partial [Planctomycetota bacterium JB042]
LGQHMHDAAKELARRGFDVRVTTSARGYDDPSVRYPAKESRDGVTIRRLPLSSFGKRSIPIRVLGALAFLTQATVRGLFTRDLGAILVSTSPPMGSLAALVVGALRRAPVTYWCMDVNPDQAIALGKVGAGSLPARLFDRLNRAILGRARKVVAMDRFMGERLEAKRPLGDRLEVVPPWPHEDALAAADGTAFRRAHGLEGKFVVMYSGNHSPAHPLDTILEAARRLRDRDDVRFVFVGGGVAKAEVDAEVAAGAPNVLSLPYQPLETLGESLSAADVHLVSFGEAMVGIVHPCKAYGAMTVGRPLLLVGPAGCPVAELIDRHDVGWRVDHGDVDGALALVTSLADGDRAELEVRGERAREAIRTALSKDALCGRFGEIVEEAGA